MEYKFRLINILKYEIFFRDQKLAEMFWLRFYSHVPYPPDWVYLLLILRNL
jgi:hypothetical protein